MNIEEEAVSSSQAQNLVIKPGKGWSLKGNGVYEKNDGTRIHMLGLCKLINGVLVHGNMWPEFRNLDRLIRINGGNRKRGMMAWANNLAL